MMPHPDKSPPHPRIDPPAFLIAAINVADEKWFLANTDHPGHDHYEIQRDDSSDVFDGDTHAMAHVLNQAATGSLMHLNVLQWLKACAPWEFNHVFEYGHASPHLKAEYDRAVVNGLF